MNLLNRKKIIQKHVGHPTGYDSHGLRVLQRDLAKFDREWEPYFIIWPRRMRSGGWMWLDDVYRRIQIKCKQTNKDNDNPQWRVYTVWEYGTIIDVLETQ